MFSTKVINDVERINIVVNGQQCTGTLSTGVSKSTKTLNEHQQQPQNQQTTGKNCAINNAVSRLKMEHRQQQHSKSRPADMNTEWDQVWKDQVLPRNFVFVLFVTIFIEFFYCFRLINQLIVCFLATKTLINSIKMKY